MAREINKIFWGFLIVLINFYLFVINISPSPIGYIIAAVGLNGLKSQSGYFSKAKIGSIVLVILSLPNIIKMDDWLKEAPSIWSLSYSTLVGLLHMIVVLLVLMGIKEAASHNKRLHDKAKNLFQIYLVGTCIALFSIPFILNTTDDMTILITIGSTIISIGLEIMFLILLRMFRSSFLPSKKNFLGT